MRQAYPLLLAIALPISGTPAWGQLIVSEVMYDPGTDEERWEWFEVRNTGPAAIDLDGYLIDRVGDRVGTAPSPNIAARPFFDGEVISNPTVLPAGGLAVLYPGPELGYDPSRFRAAWPEAPIGTTFIGVEGWSSNRLTNAPKPSIYAPNLPAMTVGLWADEAAYQLDTADFGSPSAPDRRVFRTDHATVAFGYDDTAPWPDTLGNRSLLYLDGDPFLPGNWVRTNAPWGNAYASQTTHLAAPINLPEYGSPGVRPPGRPFEQGLVITEVMANAATTTGSAEWEWIELLNTGPAIDFATTPHWLDDDDGSNLEVPNLTSGRIETDQTVILYNADGPTLDQMRAAWDRPGVEPIRFIGVGDWPSLANGGDRFGLWDNAGEYAADRAGEVVSLGHAVASLEYDDSAPWPTGVDGDAIRLRHLATPPGDPSAWARARGAFADPDGYQSAEVSGPTGLVDHAGGDEGTPGHIWPNIDSPLPGDYNRDGRVDAADYSLWRDGAPLPTETASVGVNDAEDYAVWVGAYGLGAGAATVAVPEPTAGIAFGVALVLSGLRGVR